MWKECVSVAWLPYSCGPWVPIWNWSLFLLLSQIKVKLQMNVVAQKSHVGLWIWSRKEGFSSLLRRKRRQSVWYLIHLPGEVVFFLARLPEVRSQINSPGAQRQIVSRLSDKRTAALLFRSENTVRPSDRSSSRCQDAEEKACLESLWWSRVTSGLRLVFTEFCTCSSFNRFRPGLSKLLHVLAPQADFHWSAHRLLRWFCLRGPDKLS